MVFSADSIFLWQLDDSSSMGGVDLSDMLMSLYRIDIRPRLWYLRMLCYFIDLSTVNAWLLYRRHVKQLGLRKYKPLLDFRVEIADSLIKHGKAITKKRGRPSRDADEDVPRAPRLRHSVVPREGYGWTRRATCLNIMRSVDGAQKGTRKSGVQSVVFCCVSTRLTTASCCTTPNENCPLLSQQAALTLSVVVHISGTLYL